MSLCSVFMNAIIYKCSEDGLENSVVRDTTFCLAIFFGRFLYKDLFVLLLIDIGYLAGDDLVVKA